MLALKYLLMILGLGLFGSTGALMAYDIYLSQQLRRLVVGNKTLRANAKTETTAHGSFGAAPRRAA